MMTPELEAQCDAYDKKNPQIEQFRKVSTKDFIKCLFKHNGSAYKVAAELGLAHRPLAARRKRIEEALGIELPRGRWETWRQSLGQNRIIDLGIQNGTLIVGSDLHKWPELTGTAERAFIALNQMLKPQYVIMNGDMLDGASVSRHGRIGWEQRPKLKEEVEAVQEFTQDLVKQNIGAKYYRTRGNHDGRFETHLAAASPEVEGLRGTTLSHHIPEWTECVSIVINSGEQGHTIIKHRFRHSGIHADWQNLLKTGVNLVFGHLHCQRVRAFDDARGRRYGCDAGMMAPVNGPQFAYCESDTNDWRSGFLVLTYNDGELMPPELVTVIDEDNGIIYFRGQKWEV
jgi:predicted phosphodiesterase